MPSDLQVSNLKDLTGSNTGLSIASDGQVTISQNNPTVTLGSNATFPAGHVIQVVQKADSADYINSSTTHQQATQTATFNLSNNSNKVLVTVNCLTQATYSSAAGVRLEIYRGSLASGTRITSGTEPQNYISNPGTEMYIISTLQCLDTPGGSTTYSLVFYKHGSSGTARIKGAFFNTIITLQEITV